MAELKFKDIRLPELKLPEMSRDDIARILGETRKELVGVRKELSEFRREFEMPKVEVPNPSTMEMPTVDEARAMVKDAQKAAKSAAKDARKNARKASTKMTKEMTRAAQDAGLVDRPSRLPFILGGLVTLGLVAWALMNSPRLKERIKTAADEARAKMADRGQSDWDSPRAFDSATTAGVEASTYQDAVSSTDSPYEEPPSDLPSGLGKTIAKSNGSRTRDTNEATPA